MGFLLCSGAHWGRELLAGKIVREGKEARQQERMEGARGLGASRVTPTCTKFRTKGGRGL